MRRLAIGALAAASSIFCLYLIVYAWQTWVARQVVSELCARDGGVRVYRSVLAPGFLSEYHEQDGPSYFSFEYLVKGGFEYIDFSIQWVNSEYELLFPVRGYYRVSLSTRGDADCRGWESFLASPGRSGVTTSLGIADGQCIAVKLLNGRPRGYVLTKDRGKVEASNGAVAGYQGASIVDDRSGAVLATLRDYGYVPSTRKVIDLTGFGATSPYSCYHFDRNASGRVTDLVAMALRKNTHGIQDAHQE